jgi:hypothetical protein
MVHYGIELARHARLKADVRFWHLADIYADDERVRFRR